ncbi:MAG: preprotein translocase subunit YajC [Dysgonamonadaceae bacterium]|jgi:preprotein translocase subunit YajC|nr:preprotein translocase subunit YajC [Dysgonamonadaceae bacterium]
MELLSILLQAQATGGQSEASKWSFPLMMVAIFAIMYFIMIRPQQKKQKEIKKMRESMKAGDKVITSGGIYGKIKDVNDTSFTIEIAENVRIKVDKASVFAAADDLPKAQ